MSFVSLTLEHFLLLAAAGSALLVLLFLRGKRRHLKEVSSLQFWEGLAEKGEQRGARRIENVSSLLLQLACFLVLLTAVAWPVGKSQSNPGKLHIVLVDTSAWTQQDTGQGNILEREKTLVRRYLNTLPAHDPIMLVTVDGLVVPRTPFTKDRIELERSLAEVKPTLLALDLQLVSDFARQSRKLASPGEPDVLYLGPGRIADAEAPQAGNEAFRSYLIEAAPNHCGISRVGLERAEPMQSTFQNTWQMIVVLQNYGSQRCHPRLQIHFADRDLPAREQDLAPGQSAREEYRFTATRSEPVTVSLGPGDSLSADQRVNLQLPRAIATRIALYTARPQLFSKLAEVVPNANVSLRSIEEYQPKPEDIDLMILDRVSPRKPPMLPALWITPEKDSLFALRSEVAKPRGFRWNRDTSLARGLYAQDLPVAVANVYETSAGDTPVLNLEEGPVVVVRSGGTRGPRSAVLGFDPTGDQVRYEVATPLLWIRLVQWLTVSSSAPARIEAGPAGIGEIDLDRGGDDPVERHPVIPQLAANRWSPASSQIEDAATLRRGRFPGFESWRWLVLFGLAIACVEAYLSGGRGGNLRQVGGNREG